MSVPMEMIPVEIRDAGNKGRGVFAKYYIFKDKALCYYDGKDQISKICKTNNYSIDYSIGNPLYKDIIRDGYKEPKTNYGIGQIINDGCILIFNTSKDIKITKEIFKKCRKEIKKYEKISKEKENIIMDKDFWLYSKKNIKRNEQLYLSYGTNYWLSKAFSTAKILNWRYILCMLLKERGIKMYTKNKNNKIEIY